MDLRNQQLKRIVIKIGSHVLSQGQTLNPKRVQALTRDIVNLKKALGAEVVLVSSGAVMTGRMLVQTNGKPVSVGIKQALAAVGQAKLMEIYSWAFAEHGMNVAQVLLTHDDLECRERYLNAKRTFVTLLKLGMIPIVNENDTVSTEEIRFGDNDRLSAEVAGLVGADTLVLLSDVEGLFTDDPKTNTSAKLISTVEAVGESLLGSFSESKSQHGTGGIRSKILAAKIATELGLGVWILPGHKEDVLCQALVESKRMGTFFLPAKKPLNTKRHWIYHTLKVKGEIVIDAGCEKAILLKGKSLLAQGIVDVRGDFSRQSTVWIRNAEGQFLGKGLCGLSSQELRDLLGLKPEKGKDVEAQKNERGVEVVHRDNLILTAPA